MGIKSTRDISREIAIERILEMDALIEDRNYREIENNSGEHDYNLPEYINDVKPLNINKETLEKWTDTMIEDKMDEPYYRYSMFDNYLIKQDDNY